MTQKKGTSNEVTANVAKVKQDSPLFVKGESCSAISWFAVKRKKEQITCRHRNYRPTFGKSMVCERRTVCAVGRSF